MHRRSHGYTIILVLVCLTVVMLSITAMARTALRMNTKNQEHLQQTQASWLAESGISRAVNRLANDSQYTGETWQVDVPTSKMSGTVEIRVQNHSEKSRYEIEVIAHYPLDSNAPKTERKRLTVSFFGNPTR